MRIVNLFVFGVVSLAILGCQQRVNVEKSVALEGGAIEAPIIIDGPKSEQKIKVDFDSSACPINVYVVSGNSADVLKALSSEPPKTVDALAKAEKSAKGSLDATVPAGKEYGVYLTGATKKTTVSVKVKTP